MSSFFTIPGAKTKRKRAEASNAPNKRIATSKKPVRKASTKQPAPQQKKRLERDESISGSESDDLDDAEDFSGLSDSGDDTDGSETKGETAAEKRLRLAQQYLENVRQEVDDYGFDAEEIDRDLIAERLQEDVAESHGKVYRTLATHLQWQSATQTRFRWNSQNVNAVAANAPYVHIASTDSVTKFRIQDLPRDQWQQTTKRKPKKQAPPKTQPERLRYRKINTKKKKDKSFKGHTGNILCTAVSQDGLFVATGGEDGRIVVYDSDLNPLRAFSQHRAAVTGLVFRRGTTHQLYSCARDRTVKVWSLNEMAYVETLFGHDSAVVDVSRQFTLVLRHNQLLTGCLDRCASSRTMSQCRL